MTNVGYSQIPKMYLKTISLFSANFYRIRKFQNAYTGGAYPPGRNYFISVATSIRVIRKLMKI